MYRAIYFCAYAQAKHTLCECSERETPLVHLLSAAFAGEFSHFVLSVACFLIGRYEGYKVFYWLLQVLRRQHAPIQSGL
jgi:hypothetical protein